MAASPSEADITDTSDRPGPECGDGIGESRRHGQSAGVPGSNQYRAARPAVSEPEAAAFNIPRAPEYPWRIRLVGPRVQVRRQQRVDPILEPIGRLISERCPG